MTFVIKFLYIMKQFLKIITTITLLLIVGVMEINAQNQNPKFTFKIERRADGYYYGSVKSDLALSRAKFETTISSLQFSMVSTLGTFAPVTQLAKQVTNMTNFEDLLPVIPADQGTYQWRIERTNANIDNSSTTTEYIYFTLNASPSLTDITANVDVPLFRFKTLNCVGDVRLYRNIADSEGPADKPKYNSGGSFHISGANGGSDETYNANYGGPAYCPAPDLVTTIGQPSPSPLIVGQPSLIPVNVKNIGNAISSGLITEVVQIPVGTTFGTFPTNNNGWTCIANGTTATCTNPTLTLNPGVWSDFQVPFIAATSQAGQLITIPPAKVSGGGEPLRNTFNNSSQSITVPVSGGTPDLTTAIIAPSTGLPNTPFNYTIQISNIGAQPSSGSVTESITIPAGLTFNSGGGNGFVCTPATGPVTGPATINCTNPAPNILAGGNIIFPINATPTITGSLTTTGNVSGGQDSNLNNNTATHTIQIGCGISAGVLSKN